MFKFKQYIHIIFNRIEAISCLLVSIMGFSGMPYIMVLSEDILDIALWLKNPR